VRETGGGKKAFKKKGGKLRKREKKASGEEGRGRQAGMTGEGGKLGKGSGIQDGRMGEKGKLGGNQGGKLGWQVRETS
jgi:hypothetical protein